ncbi:hypothetical protein ACBJ59_57865 [Nonomuraea sp. MTCD27]|uniref:DUF6907 domain-containing protein n=1 Tax=Nonomuraea sp. MTCD27 TaxID=1676747 RepID=UPI0035C0F9CE
MPKSLSAGDGVWLAPLAQALRHAHNTILSTQRTPCPSWCREEHKAPFDVEHSSEVLAVELKHYPYWAGNECYSSSVLVALRQDSANLPPVIGLSGPDDCPGDVLTHDEAEDLARNLLQLVSASRATHTEQPDSLSCQDEL